jgi:ribosomal protein S18 acetylase RimI-like enzyme
MSLEFRPVTSGDRDLLLTLYASTRAQELSQVPWSDEQKQAFVQMQFTAQTRHYEATYPASEHQIVLWEGEAVGRLWVDLGPKSLHVLDLTILPAARGRGIGTAVLQGLLQEGAATGRTISGYVEAWSPAIPLLERLGFRKVEEQGYYLRFAWAGASN